MDIKYLGHSSFLLKGKGASVVSDPFDPGLVGLKFPRVEAEIVTISHHHHDHDHMKLIDGTPLVINIPGEYEKNAVRVIGYDSFHDNEQGKTRGLNTMYKIDIDGVQVLHCGDLGHTISDELAEEIGEVDVLLVPVGGFFTIDAKQAHEVIKQIEPKFVIPMHYRTDKHSPGFAEVSPLSEFLKVMETAEIEPVKKLTVKKDDPMEDMKIVVMEVA